MGILILLCGCFSPVCDPQMGLCCVFQPYAPKAPANTGAFYFCNNTRHSRKAHSIPGTIVQLRSRFLSRFSRPNKPQIFLSTAKPSLLLLRLYDAFIASTYSLDTPFPIAIKDAIGPSRSHRNLMPLLWDFNLADNLLGALSPGVFAYFWRI